MAKSPHTPEFRAKFSQEYLDGSSYGFQYIVTMNSDQLPYNYLPKELDIESMIVLPRLTDTDDGGLFGFRF